jgi:pyruvate/2-oxoglutarate dehydrogenase complex dihydrolipoamide dehydrogenase (E3) component
MEEIIASGKADVVATARAMMADPDMPRKTRAGRADEVRPCLRCFVCFSGVVTKRQYMCAVNPEIGFEQECRHEPPPAGKKTVLVAGGGVAGMQAALTASERGHEVILCERAERLGGVLRCEERVPFKRLLSDYLDFQERMLSRAPVDVRLATEVTPEFALTSGADVIVAALGARRVIPDIPGIACRNVLSAEEAYRHAEQTGKNTVILGGGLVGIELAIFLAGLGRKPTILEMTETLNDGGNPLHGLALINEMRKYDIQVSTCTRAVEVNENGVIGVYVGNAYTLPPCPTVDAAILHSNSFGRVVRADAEEGSRKLYEADTVVYATGRRALWDEAERLRFCAPEFHQIGDCLIPRNIHQATSMAFTVARDIGRP